MALHEQLLPNLTGAIRGTKGAHVVGVDGGSVNYRLMDAFTAWILDPSPENERRVLELLAEQKREGHLCLRGPKGAAAEAGAPGMHWTMNAASVAGGLLHAIKRGNREVEEACTGWIVDEAGFCRALRWKGEVWAPAPRVKEERRQKPHDGYRDVFAALVLGERVKKGTRYWQEDQAIGVATVREVLKLRPSIVSLCKTAEMPRLHFPIHKHDLAGGGFVAWIDRTEEAAHALDMCDWVRCAPEGIRFGFRFKEPVPGSVAALTRTP
jgi:hypothetical protein